LSSISRPIEKEAEGWLLSGYSDAEVIDILATKGIKREAAIQAIEDAKRAVRIDDATAHRSLTTGTLLPGLMLFVVGIVFTVMYYHHDDAPQASNRVKLLGYGLTWFTIAAGYLAGWARRNKRKHRMPSQ
jgi:hypothetical protein